MRPRGGGGEGSVRKCRRDTLLREWGAERGGQGLPAGLAPALTTLSREAGPCGCRGAEAKWRRHITQPSVWKARLPSNLACGRHADLTAGTAGSKPGKCERHGHQSSRGELESSAQSSPALENQGAAPRPSLPPGRPASPGSCRRSNTPPTPQPAARQARPFLWPTPGVAAVARTHGQPWLH